MLNQTRTEVGSITFHRRGPCGVNICIPYVKIHRNLYTFLFSIIIWGNSASHFLDDYAYKLGRHAESNQNMRM